MLRLWFAFSARTQLLVVLADVEIIDYPRVELSEKLRLLMKHFERRGLVLPQSTVGWAAPAGGLGARGPGWSYVG